MKCGSRIVKWETLSPCRSKGVLPEPAWKRGAVSPKTAEATEQGIARKGWNTNSRRND